MVDVFYEFLLLNDCQSAHWKSVHKEECKLFQNDPSAAITKDLSVRPLSETVAMSCFTRVVTLKTAANPTLIGLTKYSLPRRLAEAVLEAINIHIDSPIVIPKGPTVLNFAILTSMQTDVPVVRRLVSIGVLTNTLVSISNIHPNDADITQMILLTALTHILRVPESYSDLNVSDICEMLVRKVKVHGMSGPEAYCVAGVGLGLVNSISNISIDATMCLISHGMIPVVLAVMKAHPNDSCVKDHGCSAIGSLAHGDQGVAQLTSEGVVIVLDSHYMILTLTPSLNHLPNFYTLKVPAEWCCRPFITAIVASFHQFQYPSQAHKFGLNMVTMDCWPFVN